MKSTKSHESYIEKDFCDTQQYFVKAFYFMAN